MANERERKLIREVEETQAKLRKTIEESKRLAERSDALMAQMMKDGLGRNQVEAALSADLNER